jgi:O-antigen/teichoic acid export membrane protein
MSGALAIGIPQIGSRSVLLGVGQHWTVTRATFIGSFCSILVAIITMKIFGLLGAAMGWSTIWIVQGILLYPPIIKKRLNQKYLTMLKDGYLPGSYSGVVVGVYLWLISHWIDPNNISQLILSILFATALGISCLYFSLKQLKNR